MRIWIENHGVPKREKHYYLHMGGHPARISIQAARWLIELGVPEYEYEYEDGEKVYPEAPPEVLLRVQEDVDDYCPVPLAREARKLIGEFPSNATHPELVEAKQLLAQAKMELAQAEEKVRTAKEVLLEKTRKVRGFPVVK